MAESFFDKVHKNNSHTPDVLSCLANLSNDEVFTSPDVVNNMLDMLPQELFSDPSTKFLDPACKTGVFLREIAKRLLVGLEPIYPDLQERVDHICHEQLYGIAITELTSLLSRRSLYCSKYPNGPYSITHFDNPEGNIRFKKIKHTWENGQCKYCGASKEQYDRSSDLETHAYEFIHMINIKEAFNKVGFFDVIISNCPYQLNDGGGNGASAKPIYHLFVEQAKKLQPRYMSMIIPSRWFTGGKGLDEFRAEMLNDKSLRVIHDFPNAGDCFAGVSIKGGVCYFLWDKEYKGDCSVYSHNGNEVSGPSVRPLLEDGIDTFIRYNEAVNILRKVNGFKEGSFMDLVSARMPFGFPNTFKGYKEKTEEDDLIIYVSGNDREVRGTTAFVPRNTVVKGQEYIGKHKVYISKAGSGSDEFPHPILTKPFYGEPYSVCNESYLVIGPFSSEKECRNVMTYISTKFFRFMVLLKKNSQNAAKGVYQFVPMQDFSKQWTDEELYKKYNITIKEQVFIDSMIRPMEL